MSTVSNRNTITLLIFSSGSFVLSYATTFVFVRGMGAEGFDDYAVAVSSMVILASIAEMGTGKYAMRAIPEYTENKKWSLAKGYFRFSIILIILVSLVLLVVTSLVEYQEDSVLWDYALGLAILFLPAVALTGAVAEFLMANLAVIRSALVTRILIPGATLIIGFAWVYSSTGFTAIQGVLSFGTGWLIGLIAVIWFLKRTTRLEIRIAKPLYHTSEWRFRIIPFVFFAMLITTLPRIGIIILEIVNPQETTVAVYAVAAETGAFIYLIAKSTDKMYLPHLSVLIERRDITTMIAEQRKRWLWIGTVSIFFLLGIFIFGKNILLLFGKEFVEGYMALCIIAVSTTIWTMTSLAPSYLKYLGKNRIVLVATAITVLTHIGLCFPLGYYYGATGAAISFAVPVILLYSLFSIVAGFYLRKTVALSMEGKE